MTNTKRGYVLLIFGGRGYERDISLRGADNVFKLLQGSAELLPLYIDPHGRWLIDSDFYRTPSESAKRADMLTDAYPALTQRGSGILTEGGFIPVRCAIPLLHGDFGEDGIVQGALLCAGIPFIGSDPVACALARDKAIVKTVARSLGIPTADFLTVEDGDSPELIGERTASSLTYPLFIKPRRLGSSVGAREIPCEDDLFPALEYSRGFAKKLIIEKKINIKKELEVAYFSSECKEIFTSPGEIRCDRGFYDYKKKYDGACGVQVSRDSSATDGERRMLDEYSRALIRALGVRDLARIDYFLTDEGEILFNEINTFPGFTDGSLYPALVEGAGIPKKTQLLSLIEQSVKRGA